MYWTSCTALVVSQSGAGTWRAWPASSNGGCGCSLGCCCCFSPGPCVSSPSSGQPLCWLSSSGGSISEAWLSACVYVCVLGAQEPAHSSQPSRSLMERDALEGNQKIQLGQSDCIRVCKCSEKLLRQLWRLTEIKVLFLPCFEKGPQGCSLIILLLGETHGYSTHV